MVKLLWIGLAAVDKVRIGSWSLCTRMPSPKGATMHAMGQSKSVQALLSTTNGIHSSYCALELVET